MTTKTLDLDNIERKVFWTLSALILLMAALYLYSVLTLTVAVVDRNSMSNTAHQLASKAGDLEAEYFSQTNSFTLSYAKTLGFSEVEAKFATPLTSPSLAVAR